MMVMAAVPNMDKPDEQKLRERRQRMRSIAIALALFAMVALFYLATIVRLGSNVMNRAL